MKSGDETGVGVLLAAGSGSRFRGGQHKLKKGKKSKNKTSKIKEKINE
jgi:CTP:molybdopterin cytidylyltransferase MocA